LNKKVPRRFCRRMLQDIDIRALDQYTRKEFRLPLGSDLISLDVVLAIQEWLAERESNFSRQPVPLLKVLVKEGILGRKSGHALASAPFGLN